MQKFEGIFIILKNNNKLNSVKEAAKEIKNYLGKDIFDKNNKHFEFIFDKEDFNLSIDSDRLAYDEYGSSFPTICFDTHNNRKVLRIELIINNQKENPKIFFKTEEKTEEVGESKDTSPNQSKEPINWALCITLVSWLLLVSVLMLSLIAWKFKKKVKL